MGEEARITGAGRSLARRKALPERVENTRTEGHAAATDTYYENPNRRAVSRNPDPLVEATESRLTGTVLS